MTNYSGYCVLSVLLLPLGAALGIFFLSPSESRTAKLAHVPLIFSACALVFFNGQLIAHGPREFHTVFRYRLDSLAIVFLWLTVVLTSITLKYSRVYLHREVGYQRFFATILVFFASCQAIAVADDSRLLLLGWETMGLTSCFLIAFYQERTRSALQALRAFTAYKMSDAFLIAALTLMASGRQNITGVGLFLLGAVCGKSAQFPLMTWLPRAMEGPTPSSAIFYGALSLHTGVFLLLRTYDLWHASHVVCWVMGVVGMVTAVLGTLSGRIQSNIKGQIGYATLVQIGVMLLEIAAGFPGLALFHLCANACLRCYQLLVSPSVVAYVLRAQASPTRGVQVSDWSWERFLPPALRTTLYSFAFHEGYIDTLGSEMLRCVGWVKKLRGFAPSLQWNVVRLCLVVILVGVTFLVSHKRIPLECVGSTVASVLALLTVGVASVASREYALQPRRVWQWATGSMALSALALYAHGSKAPLDWFFSSLELLLATVIWKGNLGKAWRTPNLASHSPFWGWQARSGRSQALALGASALVLTFFPGTPLARLFHDALHRAWINHEIVWLVFLGCYSTLLELTFAQVFARVWFGTGSSGR